MHFFDQLVLASSLLAAASEANPLTSTSDPSTFSVHQVVKHDGINRENRSRFAMNRIRRKFGHDAPPAPPLSEVQRAKSKANSSKAKGSSKSSNNSESAKNDDQDTQYICEVEVGGQTVRLNFDTGSSDLWVYSTEQHPNDLKDHKIYDPKKSKTAKKMEGGSWTIKYGDGSAASGVVYTDAVVVGNTTVDSQAVELAKNVSNSFLQDFSNDGLLGLGFTKGSTPHSGNTVTVNGAAKPQTTFFESARPKLPLPLFTVDLKHQAPGSYDFGYIDKSKFSGDLKYFPADSSEAYWGIESTNYGFKGQKIDRKIKTIIDTGTTLNLVPQDVLDKYYKEVPEAKNDKDAGGYIFPCETKLPDFTIGFGSGSDEFTATIPSKYMNFGPAKASDPTTCFGGMQVMAPGSGLDAIYGDVFLKAVFTVFEAASNEKARMGFAMKPEALSLIDKNSSSGSDSDSPDSSSPDAGAGECLAKSNGKKQSPAAKAIKKLFASVKENVFGIKAQKQDSCSSTGGSDPDSGDEGFGAGNEGDGFGGDAAGFGADGNDGDTMGDSGDPALANDGGGSDSGDGKEASGESGEEEGQDDEDCDCNDEEDDSGDADEEKGDEDAEEEEPEGKHAHHSGHEDHDSKSHKHHGEEEHEEKHAHHSGHNDHESKGQGEEEHEEKHAHHGGHGDHESKGEHGSKNHGPSHGSKSHKHHGEAEAEEEEEHHSKHGAQKHMKHKSKGEEKSRQHFEHRKHHLYKRHFMDE